MRTVEHKPGLFARHPEIGGILFLLGFAIFGLLLANVLTNGPLIRGDEPMIQALHQQAEHGPGWVLAVMKLGSDIGFYGIMVMILFLAGLFIGERSWRELTLLIAGVVLGEAFFDLVAGVINRPRPNFPNPYEGLQSFSFPSGHIVSSTLMYMLLLYVFLPRIRSAGGRLALIIAGAVVILWIGFSRLYLGSHYPTDVVAGLGLGVGWGGLAYTLADTYWKRRWQREGQIAKEGVAVGEAGR